MTRYIRLMMRDDAKRVFLRRRVAGRRNPIYRFLFIGNVWVIP